MRFHGIMITHPFSAQPKLYGCTLTITSTSAEYCCTESSRSTTKKAVGFVPIPVTIHIGCKEAANRWTAMLATYRRVRTVLDFICISAFPPCQ